MSKYQLGDRVRMTGTAQKRKRHHKVSYEEGPLPMTHFYPRAKIYNEGVIVGSRTVMNGEVDSDDGYRYFVPETGTSVQVLLVAYAMRRSPVMCFEHQIEAVEP